GGEDDRHHHRQSLDEDVAARQADEEHEDRGHEQERRQPLAFLGGIEGDDQSGENAQRDSAHQPVGLEQVNDHRQQGGGEQDLDDRLIEFLDEFLPKRLTRQGGELVDAENSP